MTLIDTAPITTSSPSAHSLTLKLLTVLMAFCPIKTGVSNSVCPDRQSAWQCVRRTYLRLASRFARISLQLLTSQTGSMMTLSLLDSTQQEKMASSGVLNCAMQKPSPCCSVTMASLESISYSINQSKSRHCTAQSQQYQMCFGAAEIPLTESAKTYVKATRVIIILQLLITILNFIAAAYFLKEAIFGLMFLLLLYAAQHHLSYQVIMLYIFISIFFAFRFLLFFLQPFQNGTALAALADNYQFAIYQAIVSFAYYLACAVFFYFPYKEFKVQAYNQNPALRNYFQQEREENQQQEGNNDVNKINYDLNYGDIPIVPKKTKDATGAFQIEKGKGIVVG